MRGTKKMTGIGWRKGVSVLVLSCFLLETIVFSAPSLAMPAMPMPGQMITVSAPYQPAIMKGLVLYPQEPGKIGFVIDQADAEMDQAAFTAEYGKLIRYFFAALTVPENDLWVNLSPNEKERMAADGFAATDMGGDLLVQDYVLKQLASSLTYPDAATGREFWDAVYARNQGALEGQETVNKVWVVPARADVFVHENAAFVVNSSLDVLLDQDYQARVAGVVDGAPAADVQGQTYRDVYREKILPQIRKDVNEGAQFSALRQITNAVILASWFKRNLHENILLQAYSGKNVVSGIDVNDSSFREKLYERYLEAFKVGAYHLIKEEYDSRMGETAPVQYFSGGVQFLNMGSTGSVYRQTDNASLAQDIKFTRPVIVDVVPAMTWSGQGVAEGLTSGLSAIVTSGISGGMYPVTLLAENKTLAVVEGEPALTPERSVTYDFKTFASNEKAGSAEPVVKSPVGPKSEPVVRWKKTKMLLAAAGMILGAFLVVPAAQGATFEQAANGDVVAVVAPGDSLGRIVAQYRTALKKQDRSAYEKSRFSGSLWGANGVVKAAAQQMQGIDNIDDIRAGGRLVIVKGAETVPAAAAASEGQPAGVQIVTGEPTGAAGEPVGAVTKSLKNISDQPDLAADLLLPGGLISEFNKPTLDAEAGARTWIGKINGSSQRVNQADLVEDDIKTGWWEKTAQLLASVKGSGLGWYQGVTSAGLFLLTLLRLAGGGRKDSSADISRQRQAKEEKRRSGQQDLLRKKVLNLMSLRGHVRARFLTWFEPLRDQYVEQLTGTGVLVTDEEKALARSTFDKYLGSHLEKQLLTYVDFEGLEQEVQAFIVAFYKRHNHDLDLMDNVENALEPGLRESIFPLVEQEISRALERLQAENYTTAKKDFYAAVMVTQSERYKLFTGSVSLATALETAAQEMTDVFAVQDQEIMNDFLISPEGVENKGEQDTEPKMTQIPAKPGKSLWQEDALVMFAALNVALLSGASDMGIFLATGLSPFIYRLGLASALWVHEMGHMLRGGRQSITLANVHANLAGKEWLGMLLPFYGNVPVEGRLRVDVYDVVSPKEDRRIRQAGVWASAVFAGVQVVMAHSLSMAELLLSFPFGMGAVWVLWQSLKTDLADHWLGKAMRGVYNCGVAIVVKPRRDAEQDIVSKGALVQFERMGEMTDMRGQQAAGAKVMVQDRSGDNFLVGPRLVNRKGGQLPQALKASLHRSLNSSRRSGFKGNDALDIILGHFRYGTSSEPRVNETHPHQWMSDRLVEVWRYLEDGWMKKEKNLGNAIVHNGDLSFLRWYQSWLPNEVVGWWLERILHTPNTTLGDSPKIAGIMDLLITQGMWGASVRLAYYEKVNSRIEDVFGGQVPSRAAPNTALPNDSIERLGRVFEEVFEQHHDALVFQNTRTMQELWSGEAAYGHKIGLKNQEVIVAFKAALLARLKQDALAGSFDENILTAFMDSTLEAFFMNDVFMAVKKFFDLTDHKDNTFGFGVASTSKVDGVVLAARGQPMVVGLDEHTGTVLAGSEPSAIRMADEIGNVATQRFVLDQRKNGEIVELVTGSRRSIPFVVYSRDLGRMLDDQEVIDRFEPLQDNQYIGPPPQINNDDPVGEDVRAIPGILDAIRKSWQDKDSWNSQTAEDMLAQIVQKMLENAMRQHSQKYPVIDAVMARLADATAQKENIRYQSLLREAGLPQDLVLLPLEYYTEGLLYEVLDRGRIERAIKRKARELVVRRMDGALAEYDLGTELKRFVDTVLDPLIEREIHLAGQRADSFYRDSAAYREGLMNQVLVRAQVSSRITRDDREASVRAAFLQTFKEAEILPGKPAEDKGADIVIGGIESSLWISEQFGTDLRSLFPSLDIRVTSANKLLENERGEGVTDTTVVLMVSYSGQTFGSLNSTISLAVQGAEVTEEMEEADVYLAADKFETLQSGRTFVMTGDIDTFMARAVGQKFQSDAPFCRRVLVSLSGFRPAEASTATGAATYATLTALLLRLGERMHQLFPVGRQAPTVLDAKDSNILDGASEKLVLDAERVVGVDREGKTLQSKENKELMEGSRAWSQHILDAPFGRLAGYAHLYAAVVGGFLVMDQVASLSPWPVPAVVTDHLQLGVYLFFTSAAIWLKRFWDKRTVLARTGNRTIVVGGGPVVHQVLEVYVSKLFSQSKAGTAVEVHGGNPDDHMVHRFGHRVIRGLLIFIGVPDGRMAKLRSMRNATLMTMKQAMGVQNMGVGAEVYAVGREREHNSNAASRDFIVAGEPVTQEHLQVLVHNRFDNLLQLISGYVFFWSMAKRVSTLGLPKSLRKLWPWWWPMHRTQSGARIATTTSPTSPPEKKEPVSKSPTLLSKIKTGVKAENVLSSDAAMIPETPGGVDLTPRHLRLNVINGAFTLVGDPVVPVNRKIESLRPYIVQVRTVSLSGMAQLLGAGR